MIHFYVNWWWYSLLVVQRNETSLWDEMEIRASRRRGTSAEFAGCEDLGRWSTMRAFQVGTPWSGHWGGKGDLFGASGSLEELSVWSLKRLGVIKRNNNNGWLYFHLSEWLSLYVYIPSSYISAWHRCSINVLRMHKLGFESYLDYFDIPALLMSERWEKDHTGLEVPVSNELNATAFVCLPEIPYPPPRPLNYLVVKQD